MQREQNERVQAQLDYLDQVCWEHMQKIERLSALIFKAEYYHRVGRITLRADPRTCGYGHGGYGYL